MEFGAGRRHEASEARRAFLPKDYGDEESAQWIYRRLTAAAIFSANFRKLARVLPGSVERADPANLTLPSLDVTRYRADAI